MKEGVALASVQEMSFELRQIQANMWLGSIAMGQVAFEVVGTDLNLDPALKAFLFQWERQTIKRASEACWDKGCT